MQRLVDLANVLRSKNAGPLNLTFDVMFDTQSIYERVKKSRVLTPEKIADLYGVDVESVSIVFFDIVTSLKVTIPRRIPSGSLGDNDVYGCQQQFALAGLLIP